MPCSRFLTLIPVPIPSVQVNQERDHACCWSVISSQERTQIDKVGFHGCTRFQVPPSAWPPAKGSHKVLLGSFERDHLGARVRRSFRRTNSTSRGKVWKHFRSRRRTEKGYLARRGTQIYSIISSVFILFLLPSGPLSSSNLWPCLAFALSLSSLPAAETLTSFPGTILERIQTRRRRWWWSYLPPILEHLFIFVRCRKVCPSSSSFVDVYDPTIEGA